MYHILLSERNVFVQPIQTTISQLLNKIPSDNSPLWDRNNKTHCLAVVKGDIHLFLGAWQQWVAGALFWLNSKPIKCYSRSLLQPECDFNNPLNQSKFSPQLLFFILSFCSYYSFTVEKGKWKINVTCDEDSRPTLVHQSNKQNGNLSKPRLVVTAYLMFSFAQGLPGQTITCCTSMLFSGLEIKRNHLSIMKNYSLLSGLQMALQ